MSTPSVKLKRYILRMKWVNSSILMTYIADGWVSSGLKRQIPILITVEERFNPSPVMPHEVLVYIEYAEFIHDHPQGNGITHEMS